MSQIQELRTLAFRFAPETTQLKHSCRALAFPPRWLEMIEELKAVGKRLSSPRYYSLRDKSLHQLPLALFGQLITGDAPRRDRSWLRSTTDIEAEHLQMVFAAWLAAEYDKLKIPLPANVEKDIYTESLEWQSEEHDLLVTNRNQWGTASPADNKSYELLPELIADTLSREGMTLDFDSQTLEFRRAPSSGNGVELISWAPLRWRTLHPESAYSIYIRFTLHTVPYQSFPTLHCDIGIRRWLSAQNADLGSGHHSVYMLANFPGADARPQTQRFQVSSIGWKRLSARNDQGRMYEPYWDNDLLPELFARIYPPGRLPHPECIRRDPLDFLERKGLSFAIPVHNTMTPRQHRVKPGLMPVDRSILAEQITHHLEQRFNLIYTPAPRRVSDRSSSSGNNVFLDVPLKQKGEAERRAKRLAVARAVDGRLKLEMWQQSDVVRDAIIASVVEMLGLGGFEQPRRCSDCYSWVSPELTVELRTRPLDKFADPLDSASKNDQKRATWRRAENIMRVVGGTQARSDSPFGIDDRHPNAAMLSKVRVVRVRDSIRSETPEGFAQRELLEGMSREAAAAFSQGLFQVGERVFYSLGRKPKQRKNLSPKASKARNLSLQAWNPRIVEFTVARKCEGDDPLRLAMLGHKLREAAVHTDDPMTLPLPLTLLEAAAEYAAVHE